MIIRVILLFSITKEAIGEQCKEGWEDKVDDGLDCLFFDDTRSITFDIAKQFCANKEANLIELKSEQELNRLSDILDGKRISGLWWGGVTKEGGQWKWTKSGEPLGQWLWGKWGPEPGEYYPNSDGTCIGFVKTFWNDDQWKGADIKCNIFKAHTICQKTAPPPPPTSSTTTTASTSTTSNTTTAATNTTNPSTTYETTSGISTHIYGR